jgi:hypothetical protein
VHGDPPTSILVLNSDEARTISAEGKYVAKRDERHIAPCMMRLQIDSSLIV